MSACRKPAARGLFFLALVVSMSFAASARAFFDPRVQAKPAPRVIVDSSGRFVTVDRSERPCRVGSADCTEPLFKLKGVREPVPAYISKRALALCGNESELAEQLNESLFGEKKAMAALAKAFPQTGYLSHERSFIIVLDHFGARSERARSFYLPDFPEKHLGRLVLDCQSASRAEWPALLAHELSHALLSETMEKSEAWYEEMVAQLAEVEAGGTQPERNLKALTDLALWPALDGAKPSERVIDSALYAHAYLFGKYLFQNYGGWPLIQTLNRERQEEIADCLSYETPFRCAVSAAAQNEFFYSLPYDLFFSPHRVSGQEMFRKFAIATFLNRRDLKGFFIGSRWKARQALETAPVASLRPGEHLWLDAFTMRMPESKDLTIFHVTGDGLITHRETLRRLSPKLPTAKGQQFYLVINETSHDVSILP